MNDAAFAAYVGRDDARASTRSTSQAPGVVALVGPVIGQMQAARPTTPGRPTSRPRGSRSRVRRGCSSASARCSIGVGAFALWRPQRLASAALLVVGLGHRRRAARDRHSRQGRRRGARHEARSRSGSHRPPGRRPSARPSCSTGWSPTCAPSSSRRSRRPRRRPTSRTTLPDARGLRGRVAAIDVGEVARVERQPGRAGERRSPTPTRSRCARSRGCSSSPDSCSRCSPARRSCPTRRGAADAKPRRCCRRRDCRRGTTCPRRRLSTRGEIHGQGRDRHRAADRASGAPPRCCSRRRARP